MDDRTADKAAVSSIALNRLSLPNADTVETYGGRMVVRINTFWRPNRVLQSCIGFKRKKWTAE